MKNALLIILLFNITGLLWSKPERLPESQVVSIKKATTEIRLDGNLDEGAWNNADEKENFFQNYPYDTSYASSRTLVKVTYDDQFFYVGAVIYQNQKDYIISSLKRDFTPGTSDEFAVNIDPFQDKLNGFHFAVSPLNVQREGLIDNGENIGIDWDNKWYSQVSNHVDYWIVEMAIPFTTLRYKRKPDENIWRINFVRRDIQRNEVSCWSPAPRQFDAGNLAFTGVLYWQTPPPNPGSNISIIPYITAELDKDFDYNLPTEAGADVGMDAKVAITPSLNLDLTFNPDFSQVEVDRQITNLSRFELFFPERRQFFLENVDLFGMFGFPNSRPFFSRRVGLSQGIETKVNTEGQEIQVPQSLNVPIIAGLRLSGKLNKNWRVGLLNMQTAKVNSIKLNPANYTAAVLQRRIFDRSTIGAVFVNKENFLEATEGNIRIDKNGFNRVVGLEYNLFSKDGKWEAEAFYHRSISPGENRDAQSAAVFLGHWTKKLSVFTSGQYIGRNYKAEVGFVPRTGFMSVSPGITWRFFPKKESVAQKLVLTGITLRNSFLANTSDNRLVDRSHQLSYFLEFPGQSNLSFFGNLDYTYLFAAFDPTNAGGEKLPEGSAFTYSTYGLSFNSDVRKRFTYQIQVQRGAYFNGTRGEVNTLISYRWQPFGTISIAGNYTDINLPLPYNQARFWLVGPRTELAFTRSLFFSIFLQYNTQQDNININSRLQWRFQPVSDLFLVYTDNYFAENFFSYAQAKNRALVLKVVYWVNK